MNIRDDSIIQNIFEGYLVGGTVRDFFLGKTSLDRDIAISGAENFAHKLEKQFEGTFITLDEENKIYRVVLKDKKNYIDVSELRGMTIEEDLRMRDFTINSIAYDLQNDKYIDVTGGLEDIKNKVIRSVREENYTDDPLRILRAFRFMATTGFRIDNDLIQILKKHAALITNPAKERIHEELVKLFGGSYASKSLISMYETGILELIFPSVVDMKKVPPNSHHHLDLIHHVIETVRQLEILYSKSSDEVKEHMKKVDFGGNPRINFLKIAGFLHDIGKFSTWTIEDNKGILIPASEHINIDSTKRHRFIKHDIIGAKLVMSELKNLKFSNKEIEYISDMVRYHIYPSNVISAPDVDNKVMMRFLRRMQDNSIDNILIAEADRLSALGPDITSEMVNKNIEGLDKLLNFYLENKDALKPLPKLIDGNEIMEKYGLKPSPILGKVISELKEAQINGEVVTKHDAERFVADFISMKK